MSSTAVPLARPVGPPLSESVEVTAPGRPALSPRVVLLVVVGVCAAYLMWHLDRGWMPFDDGTLAQSAQRLLYGELSHRDFDDVYTGGLTYLNAAAFRLFGTNLLSLRSALFAFFLAWVPTVYYLASRFVKPVAAAGVTFLAVAWSVPNYTAAMPSWYNLFLATFGVAALFQHLEDGRARWLVAAGIAGGLSFLVKVIGLYYVGGVLLFFVFHSHAVARAMPEHPTRRGVVYAIFVTAALLLFVAVLAALVRQQSHLPELVQFVMPGGLIAAVLVRNEWTMPAGGSRTRFAGFARLLLPFMLGVAAPVAIFLVPYAHTGSLGAFAYGVFMLPMKRLGMVSVPELPIITMLSVLPLAILVVAARIRGPRMRRGEMAVLSLAVVALVVAGGRNATLHRIVWYSARDLFPVLAVLGVLLLSRERTADAGAPLLRPRTMLLLSVTALCNLVQFPYAVPNYLCYVAPLIVLTAVALLRYLRPMAPAVPAAMLAFYLAFAMCWVNGTPLQAMGFVSSPYFQTAPLRLARGGIVVPTYHAEVYERLVPMLRRRAHGGYTWASPDCPEIYFLSGLRNPTRSLFEMFDDTTGGGANARVLRALETHGVTAIVLNATPAFSARITNRMYGELVTRYPYATMIGPYQLRWKP